MLFRSIEVLRGGGGDAIATDFCLAVGAGADCSRPPLMDLRMVYLPPPAIADFRRCLLKLLTEASESLSLEKLRLKGGSCVNLL